MKTGGEGVFWGKTVLTRYDDEVGFLTKIGAELRVFVWGPASESAAVKVDVKAGCRIWMGWVVYYALLRGGGVGVGYFGGSGKAGKEEAEDVAYATEEVNAEAEGP